MKCSLDNCNAVHRAFVHVPGHDDPQPFCTQHALYALTHRAPVIDINSRRAIASWSERYAHRM